jgi:uncharacterized protein with PIN domain
MTTDIIVFQPPEDKEVIVNKTEKEILYEKIQKTSPMDLHHFSNFMEMEEITPFDIKTSIPSLLIKKILPYCIPIIKEIPTVKIKKKTLNIFKKEEVKKRENYYSIDIQVNYPIKCIIENTGQKLPKHTVVPTNEVFSIIGIIIPKRIIKKIDYSNPDFVISLKIFDLLKSGKFGITEFQSGLYTQSRIKDLLPIETIIETVYFTNDDDSFKKINLIINRIVKVNNYYENSYSLIHRYLKHKPFLSIIKNDIKLYKSFYSEFKPPKIDIKDKTIKKMLEQLTQSKLTDKFSNNFLFHTFNIFTIFNKINILGVNSPQIKKLFQNLTLQNEFKSINTDYKNLKFKKMLEYAKKKSIAINKFNIYSLNDLSTPQKKIVELEYDKLEKLYSTRTKYIDDFNVVNGLFWAIDNNYTRIIKEKLTDVEKLVKVPKNIDDPKIHELLKNSKNISLICPHVISKARKLLEKYKTEVTKYGKIREHIIDKFSLPVESRGYFCRICGELLAESDAEEISKYVAGKRVSFVVEFDALKSQIWGETAHILSTYVKFKDQVNMKGLINSITESLRDEMGNIKNNLSKIKSNNTEGINNLMKVYITIYIFATVANMINNNYGKITYKMRFGKSGGYAKKNKSPHKSPYKSPLISYDGDNKSPHKSPYKSPLISYDGDNKSPRKSYMGGEQKTDKVRIKNIIKNTLLILMKILNVIINNVSNIDIDSIKPILLKAYKYSSGLKKSANINDSEKKEMPDFKKDLVYEYVQYVKNLDNYYKNNAKAKKEFPVSEVLGKSFSDINKSEKSLYAFINIPPLWNKSENSSYKYSNFLKTMEYVQNQLYNKNAVPMGPEISEHTKKYKFLQKNDYDRLQQHYNETLRPLNNVRINDYMPTHVNDFSAKKIKIEKYFDNNGIKHKFDIYVYQKINNKGAHIGAKKEYNKNDITDMITNNLKKYEEFKDMFIVDQRCSICKNLLSQVKNKGIDKILNQISKIEIFFKYYENRCPKGELHDFYIPKDIKKENYCTKCNITKNIIDTQDKKYYNTHLKKYENEQKTKNLIEKNNIKKLMNDPVFKSSIKKFPVWKINNKPILEYSRTFNVKYNIIINLGLSVGLNYSLIENEKINPHIDITEDAINTRNLKLYEYYLQIVRKYYLIKNYEIVGNIQIELKTILNKNTTRNLFKILPCLNNSFNEMYRYYKSNETCINLSNFLLSNITQLILDINNIFIKNKINIHKELIAYINNGLINSERLLSEPDLNTLKIKQSFDSNNYDFYDIEDDGEDDGDGDDNNESNKFLEELEDEEPDDQFATGDLDIERDNEENLENHQDF